MENNRLGLNQIIIGDPIPQWSIESIFGEEVPNVQDCKGKPMVILFFSLGCPGCLHRAIPYANRLVHENQDKLNVIGIHSNFDGIDFSVDKFKEARDKYYIRFPMYKDRNFDTTFLHYGAGGTPHWVVVDKNGVVVYSIFGSDPNNALLRLDYVINEALIE